MRPLLAWLRITVWGWALLAAPAEAAELTLWHAYRNQEAAGLEAACQAFTRETGVDVNLLAVPFGAFDSKLETAIPRGNGPDVFVAAHGSLAKWVAMDLVEPAPEAVPDLRESLDRAVHYQGTRWGVPLAYKSLVLFYDPSVIDAPPETTEQLLALAHQHTEGDRFGLAYQAAEPYFHAMWMHAFGARLVDEQGRIALDDPRHVPALAYSKKLAVDEGIMPGEPTAPLVAQLFDDGRAAMVISGPWFLAEIDREAGIAPLPRVTEAGGSPAAPFLSIEAAFVADQSAQPELAHELAAFLAGEQGATLRSTLGSQAVSHTGVAAEGALVEALQVQADSAIPLPVHPRMDAAYESQARALRRVLRGTATPAEGASEAAHHFEVLDRPAPVAVSPTPYLVVLGLALLGALAFVFAPLREASFRARVHAHRWDYAWVAPAGVAMVLLVALPFVTGASVSLFAHDGGEWTFVGLTHFLDILLARDWPLTSPLSFWFTLAVTVGWTIANVLLHVSIGVALALLLREPWVRMRSMWRALLIVPWAVPNYITALIWKGLFHRQYGAINALVVAVGGDPVDWFGSWATAFAANLATNTWLGFPFMMVVTLGALQSIPRDLEEAAEVDGADWWFRMRHVTLPLLMPALLPALILGSVWTFNMFNVVYLVSAGEPDGGTEILISEAYRWAFSRGNRYGYAAAYAVLIFGVLLAYSRGANKLAGRKVL